MTLLQTFGPGFKDMDKFFVGFDDQFTRLAKMHDDMTKTFLTIPLTTL